MYAEMKKPKENKSRAVANSVTQKKSNGGQGFGFVDNRPEALSQLKMQFQKNRLGEQQKESGLQSDLMSTPTLQRLTIAYTAADLGHPPLVPPAFADQVVHLIVYQRAGIPNGVKAAVDGLNYT